jgi:uncharacterized membrane protein
MNKENANNSFMGKIRSYIELKTMGFRNVRFLTTAAFIGTLYAALVFTPVLSSAAFYGNQIRVAEALTILPFFTPAAIPGLFIGCLVANMTSPFGPIDIIFGSTVSLIAAILSRKLPQLLGISQKSVILSKIIVPLPPVILNALYVGYVLNILDNAPLIPTIISVAIGETIACYGLGVPLMIVFSKKYKFIKI